MLQLSIGEVMTSPVETIEPGESARSVATILAENEFGSLVVCEGGAPVGIVTYSDVTKLVSEGRDPDSTAVESFMSTPIVTIHEDESIDEAAKALRANSIKRLPVVDGDGDVVGIVTTTDLSNYIPHLVRLNPQQETPERTRHRIRPDVAYEDADWEHEYLGDEGTIDVGDTSKFTKTISDDDVESFAEITGDTNRVHLDQSYAERTRFGGRIVHGALVVGLVSAALARLPGSIIYLSQDVRYLAPVDIGDRATASCEVVEHIGDDRYRLTTQVYDGSDELVVDGEAVVLSDGIPDESD